jgi:hypothetical protein
MTTDPLKKKFLYSMAEDGGLNPNDLFDVDAKKVEDVVQQRGGGGVSAPAVGAALQGAQVATV